MNQNVHHVTNRIKTIVQCDFDGTITSEDVSFALLEACTDGSWKKFLKQYYDGAIPVGTFNTIAFGMIRETGKALLGIVRGNPALKVRPGLAQLIDICHYHGIRFDIVSNGLDFYIRAMLHDLGLYHVRVHAARTRFRPTGLQVNFFGPDGRPVEDGFKLAYTDHFLEQGYRVWYVGNGVSDVTPARRAHHIFATADLLASCREMGLRHTPFHDLADVARHIERLVESEQQPDGAVV